MLLFPGRWPNGECSIVLLRTKADAIIELNQRSVVGPQMLISSYFLRYFLRLLPQILRS